MKSPITLPDESEIRSITCLMINGIGDIICVTPTIQALKEKFPKATLSVVIRPHLRDLLKCNPYVDELIYYENGSIFDRLKFFWHIWRKPIDLWVDLHPPTFNTVTTNDQTFRRNAIILKAAKARYQLAYAMPQYGELLSHPVCLPSDVELINTNIVDLTLGLLGVGLDRRFKKHIPYSSDDLSWANKQIDSGSCLRIGFFFGSRQPSNIWPENQVSAFINGVLEELPDAEIILIGGANEWEISQKVFNGLSHKDTYRIKNLIKKANLNQTAALIASCDIVVATDSGPMHIADAVNTPMIALLPSRNYLPIWAPIQSQTKVLNHHVDCAPCLQSDCHRENLCMNLISAREVLETLFALRSVLDQRLTSRLRTRLETTIASDGISS